ncbi:hypothetical protein [Geothrix sp. 21YS21S-4]|uniref:hypothetical protein n=1 Tax=Geothrix sp. 21YS21S-4 TaxID=3068889 RepID=UPI0027BAA6A7|nr:hypothetical protein [Geothrix sp. 21YS21S-4]
MRTIRPFLLILLVSSGLLAQVPAERISAGFKSLGTGSWGDAFKEWDKQALPYVPVEQDPRKVLEEWIPSTWSIGGWELLQSTPIGKRWQRQWWLASFDQGVVFFSFDHVFHKGEWRIFRIQVSRDPAGVLPGLDLYPSLLARN